MNAFGEKIENKYILFDSGVITKACDHFDSFEDFFVLINKLRCVSTYFPFVEFEFLRGAHMPEHKKERKKFLAAFAFAKMPLHPQLVDDALKIANSYSARKLTSPSLVDCCIAAYLKHYASNLFLVTLNHKDFPTFLFNRFFIYPIDTEQDVLPLGFYQFDIEKGANILDS